jgi:hypothetical protein
MKNVHAERSAGWSALVYVIVTVVAGLLPGTPPPVNASADAVGSWVSGHQLALLWAAWLAFPGIAFFLWYVVGLRAHLRGGSGPDEGLPTFMLVAGVIVAAFALLNAFFQAILGYRAGELGGGELRVLYDAFGLSGVLLYAPLAIFTFAAAHSIRRHATMPDALAWLGYLAALLLAVSTFSIFVREGPLRPNAVVGLLSAAVYALWTLGTAVALVRQRY